MEKREKSFVIKAVGEENSYQFEGYLATYGNKDRTGDTIEKGAFDKEDGKQVTMLYNHSTLLDNVIGHMILKSDNIGLKIVGKLNQDLERARTVYSMLKHGDLTQMSVGMIVKRYEPKDAKEPWRNWIIKEAEVVEGSVVVIPANPDANITSVKNADENRVRILKQRIQNL